MNMTITISAAALATSVFAGTAGTVSAQSDRTMGINCTVAGHIHCGENRPIFGSSYRSHRYRHAYRTHRYSTQRQVIRDDSHGQANTGTAQSQPRSYDTQGNARPETQGQGGGD
jgi:hypothetical protein